MNEWSLRRKRIILLLTLFCFVTLLGVPIFFFLHKTPTCSDGSMNGDEKGVDCGGSCKLICKAEALPMLTKGDPRVIQVATSTYEVIVVAQNPNVSASVIRAKYTFKLFSGSSTAPIKVIEGDTFIPRDSLFGLFEGPFKIEDARPVRSTFEWKQETLKWEKDLSTSPDLQIENSILSNTGVSPRLEASIKNNSLQRIINIEAVALVMDANSNIIGASKTFIESLEATKDEPLVFTWPAPFMGTSTSVEIIPRILPDQSYIR